MPILLLIVCLLPFFSRGCFLSSFCLLSQLSRQHHNLCLASPAIRFVRQSLVPAVFGMVWHPAGSGPSHTARGTSPCPYLNVVIRGTLRSLFGPKFAWQVYFKCISECSIEQPAAVARVCISIAPLASLGQPSHTRSRRLAFSFSVSPVLIISTPLHC